MEHGIETEKTLKKWNKKNMKRKKEHKYEDNRSRSSVKYVGLKLKKSSNDIRN